MSMSRTDLLEAVDLATSQALQLVEIIQGLHNDPPAAPADRDARYLYITNSTCWLLLELAEGKLAQAKKWLEILMGGETDNEE